MPLGIKPARAGGCRRAVLLPLLALFLVHLCGRCCSGFFTPAGRPGGSLAFRAPVRTPVRLHALSSSTSASALEPGQRRHQARSSTSTSSTSITGPLRAWPTGRDPKSFAKDFPQAGARIGMTVLATVLTYIAHTNQRVGSAVLASAAVTLAGSLVAPGLGQAVMCGTFTGMSSQALFPSLPWAVAAGALTSLLYEGAIHVRNAALGLGGRLGAIAFIAVNAIALLRGINGVPAATLSGSAVASTLQSALSPAAFQPGTPLAITVGFTALGAVATIALREASDDSAAADPVRAAAVVGLLGALLVGLGGFCELASLSTYGGAFVGMSLPSRLMRGVVPGKRPRRNPPATAAATTVGAILASFATAGALAGLIHGLSLQLGWFKTPAGWGGKAGACAFLGVATFRGGQRLLAWLSTKLKKQQGGKRPSGAGRSSRWRD